MGRVEVVEMRICKECGKKYPISDYEFYITSAGKRKQRWQCGFCRSEKQMQRYHKKAAKECPNCKMLKQPFEFVRENSLDYKAYGKICRECAYSKNKKLRSLPKFKHEKLRQQKSQKYLNRYRETKKYLINLFGDKCAICGKRFEWYAYDFHHKNGSKKEAKISKFTKLSIKSLQHSPEFQDELKKCILVCAVCHRKLHVKENGYE